MESNCGDFATAYGKAACPGFFLCQRAIRSRGVCTAQHQIQLREYLSLAGLRCLFLLLAIFGSGLSKRDYHHSVDLDWKRGMRCFWGRPVENLTADGKEKGCLRTDSNTRLEKYGFCGELFTTMAANNSSHHCTYVPPFLSSGEVYDSLSLIWSWLSELLWPKELGISDAVWLLGLGLKDLVAFVLILSGARWHLKRSGLFC